MHLYKTFAITYYHNHIFLIAYQLVKTACPLTCYLYPFVLYFSQPKRYHVTLGEHHIAPGLAISCPLASHPAILAPFICEGMKFQKKV